MCLDSSGLQGRLTPEQREQAGIADGLIRVAVGLEDIEDLKGDIRTNLITKAIRATTLLRHAESHFIPRLARGVLPGVPNARYG